MHVENCSLVKQSNDLDGCSTPYNTSVLEEDLALSSSTLGQQDKSLQAQSEVPIRYPSSNVIYVNEDTMDCSYAESVGIEKTEESREEVSSPEMFQSDDEYEEKEKGKSIFSDSIREEKSILENSQLDKSRKLTDEELIAKSDRYLLARINKFLSGVPPPPKHTICQSDCADFLDRIRANREYFYFNPFSGSGEELKEKNEEKSKIEEKIAHEPTNGISFNNHRGRSSLRNLTTAFDACDATNESTTSVGNESTKENFPENSDDCNTSAENQMKNTEESQSDVSTQLGESLRINPKIDEVKDKSKHVTFKMPNVDAVPFCSTITIENARDMPWELAYRHKTHGIHYNRSKIVEDFEGLTLKLCQRYIGAETQTTCNIWYTKQTPSSVKKRNLLSRLNNGQSPGKRLSHLARRRRTFSSANLQGLGLVDKNKLLLNIKKPTIKKGKSPRGKSPRGKSPRGKSPRGKSPRGSAKKRAGLKKVSPSPRKSKLETSKRALFQSPPGDRAGPSSRISLTSSNSRTKRALFPNSIPKNEVVPSATANDVKRVLTFEESKKRKSEEDLEGPKFKWAKSLSFDYVRESSSANSWTLDRHSTGNFHMKNETNVHQSELGELQRKKILPFENIANSWSLERHSSGNFHMKSETSLNQGKCELSELHRKKLLWAVAEALRGRGISMGHPRFKQCASQLARIVKKYMPDLENPTLPRMPGSTSDRMLRLAKRHVLLIVESKSTE